MRSRCSSLHRTLLSNTFSRRILQRRMRSLKYGSSIKPMALARLKSVAGVIIPDAARQFCEKHQVPPERADLVWKAIALHTSPGIATRLADEIALVHLGAGLELFGLGLNKMPPQVVEEVFEKYPRMNFKAEFRNLLVQHCRNNPAAQVLNWTDDVARTAGCTLRGQPIPTASQLMSAAPYTE